MEPAAGALRAARDAGPARDVAAARPLHVGLATNVDAPLARRAIVNAGAQLDVRLSLLSVLDLTVSVGGGIAFEQGHAPKREGMVSLKVLS